MITRRHFLSGCTSAFAALSSLSLFSQYGLMNSIAKSIPILLYHRVGPEGDPLTITTRRFQKDMETLSQENYTPLSLTQLKQHMLSPNEPVPAKPIVITFENLIA